MNREEALDVLIAHACCSYLSLCDKCPWNGTDNCENTSFSEVLEEAISVILGNE